jgi:hypothetical protein
MNFSFSILENKLLLEIAEKPRSIRFLYREYVEKGECSRSGYYKAIANLTEKGVISQDPLTHILALTTKWISDCFDFFKELKQYKRLDRHK